MTGVIGKNYVNEGDFVKVGQAILSINTERNFSSENDVNLSGKIYSSIDKEVKIIERQILNMKTSHPIEISTLDSELDYLELELSSIVDQIEFQKDKVATDKSLLEKMEKLFLNEIVSQRELTAQKSAFINSNQLLFQLKDKKNSIKKEIDLKKKQLRLLPFQYQSNLSNLQISLEKLNQQIFKTESESGQVVLSPIEGVVNSLIYREGQSVASGDSVAIVTGLESQLKMRAFVSSRLSGQILPGQDVIIKYDAFPDRQFGTYSGSVTKVSASTILPNEIATGELLDGPTFQVDIDLESSTVSSGVVTFDIRSGSEATLEIILEEKSIFEWIQVK